MKIILKRHKKREENNQKNWEGEKKRIKNKTKPIQISHQNIEQEEEEQKSKGKKGLYRLPNTSIYI